MRAQRQGDRAQADREREHQQAWGRSPLRARVQRDFVVAPAAVARQLDHGGGVLAAQEHWHTVLLYEVLRAGRCGDLITLSACTDALAAHGIAVLPDLARRALGEWLAFLQQGGYTERRRQDGPGRWRVGRPVRTDQEKESEVAAVIAARDRLRRDVEVRRAEARAGGVADGTRCRVCGGAIATTLEAFGVHIGCHPR